MAEVEHTGDGRFIVVKGRRWRATDPRIPEPLRKELVVELMAARRAVKEAAGREDALVVARRRVQNAKVALGERGDPWWEPTPQGLAARARAATLALLTKRGADSSICPSDVARIAASPEWRPAMDEVRSIVGVMAAEGSIVITQGDEMVHDLGQVTGPIRLRLPAGPSLRIRQDS